MEIGIALGVSAQRKTAGASAPAAAITAPTLQFSDVGSPTDASVTVGFTIDRDLTTGRPGFRYSIGEGNTSYQWKDGAGTVAGPQSVTYRLADLGAVPGDVLNIDPGYSTTDPATTKVYASDSGLYPTAIVATPNIGGPGSPTTFPASVTAGDVLTGIHGTIVGPIEQVITENWLAVEVGSPDLETNEGATTAAITTDANNVGFKLKFQSISTKGGSVVTATSSATGTVQASASGFTLIASNKAQGAAGGGGVTNGATIDSTGADLIVVVTGSYQGTAVPTFIDSNGNAWNKRTEYTVVGDIRLCTYWSRPSSVGPGHTFSFGGANTYASIAVAAYSGSNATPYGSENGASSGSAASLAAGNVTPAAAGNLIVYGHCHTNTNAPAINPGDGQSALLQDAPYAGGQCYEAAIAYGIATDTAARNPAWSWTGSTSAVSNATVFAQA